MDQNVWQRSLIIAFLKNPKFTGKQWSLEKILCARFVLLVIVLQNLFVAVTLKVQVAWVFRFAHLSLFCIDCHVVASLVVDWCKTERWRNDYNNLSLQRKCCIISTSLENISSLCLAENFLLWVFFKNYKDNLSPDNLRNCRAIIRTTGQLYLVTLFLLS